MALGSELERIPEKIEQHLLHAYAVAHEGALADPVEGGLDVQLQVKTFVERLRAHQRNRLLKQSAEREGSHVELESTRLDARDVEDVVDQVEEQVARVESLLEEAAHLIGQARLALPARAHGELQHAKQSVEWGAHLV